MGPKNRNFKNQTIGNEKCNFIGLKYLKYSCTRVIHSRRNSVSYLRVHNTTLLSSMSALALKLVSLKV